MPIVKNIKAEDVANFEKLERQLHVFYKEISALSKKSANDGVNKFKLGLLNKCISGVNELTGPPLEDFEVFDVDSLPSNSDVALVIGQYVSALLAVRKANTESELGNWYWMSNGKKVSPTEHPSNFTYSEK
jgi:hypothetical protein